MSDKEDPKTDVQGDGKTPAGERTFTQSELNAVVTDRLARERAKYEGFDDLKKKSEKWDELEEAQKTETQKAIEAQQRAEADRDSAIKQANETLIRAAFLAEAGRQGAEHPEDAYLLAKRDGVKLEDGQVIGVDAAVQSIIDDKRLTLSGKPKAPNLDGGAGSGNRASDQLPALSEQEIAMARKMNLTPEDYQKYKNKE